MPLQTDRLVMIGLGSLNDTPPVNLQPPLADGIHLRWAFQRELGFPWHGYYLFRRPHELRGLICVADSLGGYSTGYTSATSLVVANGIFSSDGEIVLTEDFGPAKREIRVTISVEFTSYVPIANISGNTEIALVYLWSKSDIKCFYRRKSMGTQSVNSTISVALP